MWSYKRRTITFDVSVWELFWPLIVGARLALIAPGMHGDPVRLVETIRTHRVTTLHFVPSMLQAFLQHEQSRLCDNLRYLICSGEVSFCRAARSSIAGPA